MRDWLARAFDRRPYHPFVITPEGPHSFEEVEHRVRCAVGALQQAGIGPGDRVALWPGNDVDSVVGFFSIPRTGASVAVLNTRLTAEEARAQASYAKVDAMVGPAPDLGVARIGPLDGPAVAPTPADPHGTHSIFFTSGSSGRPKGVRLTWANLEASAAASAIHLRHEVDDRWLAVLPIFHVGGFMILVRSAREASTVVLEPRFDADRAAELLGRVSLASFVAVMLDRVLEAGGGAYQGVRAVLLGGGPTPQRLLDRAAALGLPVLPTYGMTETASQIATAPLEDGLRPRRAATAMPGAEVRLGPSGRIFVRGPMVSPGYLGEPDRESDWLETGDVGEIDEIGRLTVLGRTDDVIVTGGENVHPLEVEAAIREHPQVVDVAVVGMPDPRWGEVVAAVYEGAVSPGDLDRKARYKLAGYKVPRRWVHVEQLPRLSIGKVDRAAVRKMVMGEGE